MIADKFNKFLVNIHPRLASKILPSNKTFQSYLQPYDSTMETSEPTIKELRPAFCTLKSNKSEGFDEISINDVKRIFEAIESPLCYIFNLSLKYGIFPCRLKIARVTPIYKAGDEFTLSNYRPISILLCFSKLLERIMYYIPTLQNMIFYTKINLAFKQITRLLTQSYN